MVRLVTLVAAAVLAMGTTGDASQRPSAEESAPPRVGAAAEAGRATRPGLPISVEGARRLQSGAELAVTRGDRLVVTARVGRTGTRVLLQRRAAAAWSKVAAARAGRTGAARLAVPTAAVGPATYRLLATRPDRPARTSQSIAVRVLDPAGAAREPAPAPSGTPGAYTLLDPGRPGAVFRWDPCTPVRYRVRPEPGYPTLRDDVAAAVATLGAATGLQFTDQGPTSYRGDAVEPAGFPGETDLVVTVAAESEAPALAGGAVGYTTLARSVWAGADARILQAEVVLEREFLTSGSRAVRQLLLHELGHAAGLGHTDDPRQVMFPSVTGETGTGYQQGDLAGLARVGAGGGCLS